MNPGGAWQLNVAIARAVLVLIRINANVVTGHLIVNDVVHDSKLHRWVVWCLGVF